MVFDYIIIGGGVIGCSIANKLTRLNKSCVLIDKSTDVSTGCSKANSGIIHAGFDAKPGTLKAKLNVRGNFLYEKLCKELSVPFRRTGAVVVGNDKEEIDKLLEKGKMNGVDLKLLSEEELKKLIPNLNNDINMGILAEKSGLISPYVFTIALMEEAVLNGSEIELNFFPEEIRRKKDEYVVMAKDGRSVIGKYIINCAAAGYNEIAKLLGVEEYEIEFKRGEYYVLDTSAKELVDLTIFPLPTKNSKGILVTPTIDGNILIGPTSYTSEYKTETTKEGLDHVYTSATAMINNIPFKKVIRVFSGVRVVSGEDFIIEKSKRCENVINIAGICSPGLSAAPAIAEMVAKELLEIHEEEKEMVRRTPVNKTSDLSFEELNKLIEKDKDFGKVICRCENVTLAEIKQAINSPLKPKTVDGIKRRVRAGMGRCQGGYCFLHVIEEIAKETNLKDNEINKEYNNSNIILCNMDKEGK